jgi:hypothetical protein
MENRRKRSENFAIFLVIVFVFLFCSILLALVGGHLAPEDKTAIIGWGSGILGILGTAAAYEWGSSKDTSAKNETPAHPPAKLGTATVTADLHVGAAAPMADQPKTGEVT